MKAERTGNGNAACYFIDRHLHEGRTDKPAYREVDGNTRDMSYGELSHLSSQCAGALRRSGIGRESRALMLVLDQIEMPVIFWGALKAGVIPVPLNTLLATSVYEDIFRDSRATCLFVSAQLYPTVEPLLDTFDCIKQVIVLGETVSDSKKNLTFQNFMKGAQPLPTIEVHGDEVAFWLYSSGSTGKPKGVIHVHSSLQYTADTYGAQVLGIQSNDLVYSVAKIFFAYGFGNAMTFPLSVGATTLLLSGRPTPDSVTDLLTTHQPTVFCGVPTLYAALIHFWETANKRPQVALRCCISAGEALPEKTARTWQSVFGVDIMDGVGSTEMLHIFLSNKPNDIVYGTSGTAVPGYEVRLCNEHAAESAQGEIGELLVRGTSAANGYWNQRNKSRATFEGEWTRTGDKYEMTAEGRFIYCGRTDDMFKVSGIWLSPFEVEQALIAHPAVLEAAVVACRDGEGLEKPKAFITLADTLDNIDQLKEFVKEKVGKWKYPRWIEIVDELPKTATGKIQRFKLRDTN